MRNSVASSDNVARSRLAHSALRVRNLVFYWSSGEGVPAARIAKFQSPVEKDLQKLTAILCVFMRFRVKKRSKHVGFRTCNPTVAAASGRRREGAGNSKSVFDQHLGRQMFHVKQIVNKNSSLSSPAIGFHFLPFLGFLDCAALHQIADATRATRGYIALDARNSSPAIRQRQLRGSVPRGLVGDGAGQRGGARLWRRSLDGPASDAFRALVRNRLRGLLRL